MEAYAESTEECLLKRNLVPQWYAAMEGDRIIGGSGVIKNNFHDREDLIQMFVRFCVEEEKRRNGVAGTLLNDVCTDMKEKGIATLCLVTDHTSFYEQYGWEFLCVVQGDGEPDMSRM